MVKYKKCANLCDYEDYYIKQATGKYPQNLIIQRGSNWFTNFAKRYGFPVLKFIGKHIYETGKDIFRDVMEGQDIKTAAKSNVKKGVSRGLQDLSERMNPQSGSGRKRKRSKSKTVKIYKKRKIGKKFKSKKLRRKKTKSIRKDIFGSK